MLEQEKMNLSQIKETYYFRTRIPVDLVLWFNGKEDIRRSLKTKSLKQARRLLKVWNYRTEETFTLMRSGMLTHDQIKKLADNFKNQTLADLEQNRAEAIVNNPSDIDDKLELLEELESDLREALATNDIKKVSGITDSLIEDNGLGDVSKSEYNSIARELLKKAVEVMQIEQQRAKGNYQNGYDDRVIEDIKPIVPSIITPVTSPLLSDVIDKHMEDLRRKEAASDITLLGYSGMLQMFLRIVGNVPVQEITRDTFRNYLDTFKKLPPNVNKLKKFRGKSIEQILTLNAGGKTIAIDTISKSLTVIKTLFSWMLAEDVITKNHADVLVAPKKEVRSDEQRNVFSTSDLQRLVEGLKQEEEKGKLKDHPERYWLPLISLFTGMRLGEISQLHINDVDKVDGIWCFKVQTEGDGNKSVKNLSSLRVIPVHEKLIELGFIKYVELCKDAKQPRLWMKLTLDSKGKWYKNFSNWFLKHSRNGEGFLKIYMTTEAKKDFHSFRHTMINQMKQNGTEEVKIAELVGHTNSSITTGRYGKRYEIAKMKETIDSLRYDGVEFLGFAGLN